MKALLIVMFFCCIGLVAHSQSIIATINGIKTQNMAEISANLANTVELTINSRPSTLRKNEAVSELGEYLQKIQPTGYQKGHQGNLDADKYQVGTLTTGKGKYRLYLFSESNNGLVKEIRLSAVQSN